MSDPITTEQEAIEQIKEAMRQADRLAGVKIWEPSIERGTMAAWNAMKRIAVESPADIFPPVDYEAWALDMCSLLDRIECETTDETVRKLAHGRLEMAEKHGLEVVIDGEATAILQ